MREYIPSGEISRYVECFWLAQPEERMVCIPDGTFDILFSSDPSELNGEITEPGLYCMTLRKHPVVIRSEGWIIGARMKAFVQLRYPDERLRSLSGGITSLNPGKELSGYTFSGYPIEVPSVFFDLEELILERFVVNERLRYVVNQILERKGRTSVSTISEKLQISRQALHRNYSRYLDIPLKELAVHWKLSHFLLEAHRSSSLTAASLESGFYDQAHCVRSFRQVYKVSPSGFISMYGTELPVLAESIQMRFRGAYDPKPASG